MLLWLLGIFAAVALALATIGVYGVMSYAVRQRTPEIGTRIALGATGRHIVWSVMRNGLGIAACGLSLGLGTSLLASQALNTVLYGVTAGDPLTFGLAAGTLALATLAACYVPARRAARVGPRANAGGRVEPQATPRRPPTDSTDPNPYAVAERPHGRFLTFLDGTG